MPPLRESFSRLVSALDSWSGRPSSVTADRSPFEGLVACYWERVGSARQADAVVAALDEAGLLTPDALAELDVSTLLDLLRQGSVSVSPKLLKPFLALVRWGAIDRPELLDPSADGSDVATGTLRDELLAIPGIGQATADEILLRVFGRDTYPLDRATYRILLRHGWVDSTADYDEAAEILIRNSEGDPNLLTNLSLWFAELGRSHCRAGGPKCARCPLESLLPEGGPQEWDQ